MNIITLQPRFLPLAEMVWRHKFQVGVARGKPRVSLRKLSKGRKGKVMKLARERILKEEGSGANALHKFL